MVTDFEHLNLAEVNPEIELVPEGEYEFRVVKAEMAPFLYKKDNPERGISAGDPGNYIKFRLAIVNDPENSGRMVFEALFPDNKSARFLRLIQDATGVMQGGSVKDWLEELSQAQATFKAPVKHREGREGKTEAKINFNAVQPA